MLSVKKVQSSGKTTDYFAKDDYYASNDPNHQKFSEWFGLGAKELKLEGHVTSEAFQNILEGILPNGQKIGINKGTGNKVHDAGRDLTFSAPKTVSIMALVYGDKRLIEAHNKAVKHTLAEIERNYFKTRVKIDGQIYLENTGKIVSAIFRHELSRDLDPQLHSHAIIANLTHLDNCNNNNWRTGYFDEIYNNRNFLGAIYRSHLAKLAKQLGYEISQTGQDCLLELKEVPQELIKFFSNRSIKIREFAQENSKNPISPTDKELERATILTRQNKEIQEHDHNLYGNWQQAAKQALAINPSLTKPQIPKENAAVNLSPISEGNISEAAINSLSFAINHLSERKTVFSKEELSKIALNDALGKLTYQEIEAGIVALLKDKSLLVKPSVDLAVSSTTFTTAKLLAIENTIIDLMVAGKNHHQPIIKDFAEFLTKIKTTQDFENADMQLSEHSSLTSSYLSLNSGQKQAAELILTSKDMVIGVQGYAGVGKTFMLNFVNQVATSQNYQLIGLSPTKAATKNLENEAGIKSQTLQKFLLQYDGVAKGRGTKQGRIEMSSDFKNKIVVVDEASMIGSEQMKNLLTIAKELNFKLVLVGDRKQLDSVEAGVPFYELQRNGIALAQMKEILRQKNPNLKEAVYDLINQRIEQSFAKINYDVITAKGSIGSIVKTAVAQFLALDEEARQNTLILTSANETKTAINQELSNLLFKERKQEIQKALSSGILSTSIASFAQEIYQNKNLTEAEKTRVYRFKEQDIILFTKDRKSINSKKNEYVQVVGTDLKENLIKITQANNRANISKKLQSGLLLTNFTSFNPEKLKGQDNQTHFEVFTKSERIFKIGDKIAFSRNINAKLTNGTQAIITKITKSKITNKISKISIALENNQIIELKADAKELRYIDHAYAITAHKAQGLTTENVIAVCESYRKELTSQKNFYVEISRAKERAIIITDNQEKTIKQLKDNTGIEISARQHQGILSIRAQERQKQQEGQREEREEGERSEKERKSEKKAESEIEIERKIAEKPKPEFQRNNNFSSRLSSFSPSFRRSEAEIKEHFLNAIKSNIILDAKDVISAIDQAFNKISSKVRFGQKKEYEICWHGEAGYVKNYKTDEIIKWGVKSIKFEGKFNYQNQTRSEILKSEEKANKLAQQEQIVLKNQQIEQRKTQKDQEITKEIAKKAQKIFAISQKASLLNSLKNQYLIKKGINRHIFKEIKFDKDNRIVIPLQNSKGEIQSLQFISQDGKKTFLTQGKKQGNFCLLDQEKIKNSKVIYLAEGFATAASINIATSKPVAICFDAGNIEPVLKNLKTLHPDKEFIIAADNDAYKERNIGKEKAEIAASKYQAKVVLPEFHSMKKDKITSKINEANQTVLQKSLNHHTKTTHNSNIKAIENPSDFNDLHLLHGLEEVRRQIIKQNQYQGQISKNSELEAEVDRIDRQYSHSQTAHSLHH